MNKSKKHLTLLIILAIILSIIAFAFIFKIITNNDASTGNITSISVAVLVILFLIYFISRRYKDVKKGLPLEDERSQKIMNRTAAMSFYTSLYWLLTISMFEPFFAKLIFKSDHLTASQTTSTGIAGMAIFFGLYWFYYNKA